MGGIRSCGCVEDDRQHVMPCKAHSRAPETIQAWTERETVTTCGCYIRHRPIGSEIVPCDRHRGKTPASQYRLRSDGGV